jgi:hypothetical protein
VSEPQEGATGEVRVPTAAHLAWVAEQLRVLADDIADMAGEGGSPARAVAAELAGSGRRMAEYLSDREPTEVLADLRDFARDRPAEFLASALAVGFVVGQFDAAERPKHAEPEPAPTAPAEDEPTRLERMPQEHDTDATVPVSPAPAGAQPAAAPPAAPAAAQRDGSAPPRPKKELWDSPPILLSEPMSPSPYASETYYDDDPPAR